MNQRTTLLTGIITLALAVGLGAFGAHALEPILIERGRVDTWDLAVLYQMIHGLGLLAIGILFDGNIKWFRPTSIAMLAGIICFSGSLYLLCLTDIIFPLVLITPFGGVLMIASWILMFVAVGIKFKNGEQA